MNDEHKFQKMAHKTQWLPVSALSVVWAQSQREFDERHANEIASKFDPDMFGVLAVTKPNGKGIYHVIDGQHRKAAVQQIWGDTELVPCNVFEVTDPSRAAEIFDQINKSRRNPSPIDTFRVRVTAGREVEVAVNKIVQSCGYRIEPNKNQGCISAVNALVGVYKSTSAESLKRTLNVLTYTWDKDPNAVVAPLLYGYGAFVHQYYHADLHRLAQTVAKRNTPGRLLGKATTMREAMRINMRQAVKKVLLAAYNHGLKADNKLAEDE